MTRRSIHARGRVRVGSLLTMLALVGALVVATTPAWSAVGACKVQNLSTNQQYAGGGEALTNAIADASSGDRLGIKGTCVGNYTLDKDLTLIGKDRATLDANGSGKVLTVNSGTVKLVNLTITGGGPAVTCCGSGIVNFGNLTINQSTVSGNAGDAISNVGSLAISRSDVSGNSGIGIENDGPLTINRSILSGNTTSSEGGGIDAEIGTVTITRSTISGNSASKAGGIHVSSGTVTVIKSEVSGNQAADTGGGFDINIGSLTLNQTTVTGNTAGTTGGGIYNFGGSLTLISSTVSGNTPDDCVGAGC